MGQTAPGVKSASMTIAEMVVQVFEWIESEVEKRVRTTSIHTPNSERKMKETIGVPQLRG